jgi:mannosyltransferase
LVLRPSSIRWEATVTVRELFHHEREIKWLALLLVLWAAFSLRVAGIARQSIWYDEGLSIYYARGDIGEVLRGVSRSDHPPLHPLLLHLWMGLCGDGEFSVRMLSTWWGVVAVALIYRLGRRLFDRTVGTLAALLLTVSPFAIWFAQEARGYTMALALTLGAVDAALDLFPRTFGIQQAQRSARGLGYAVYVLWAAAALYTHFYSALVLLALNLAFLAWWLVPAGPRSRRRAAGWLLAQVAVVALFAPWLPYVIVQWGVNATYWHGAVYWKEIVGRTVTAFGVGTALSGRWASGATWSLSLLTLLGTVSLFWHRRDRLALATLWTWVLVPTLALVVITRSRPKFSPRYLMNVLPAFLLLVAVGGRWLSRVARRHAFTVFGGAAWVVLLLLTAMAVGATVRSLANHYFDDRFDRPDMRGAARYIDAQATPEDLIVLVGGHIYPAFTYYYGGPLPVVPLPDKLLPTTHEPIDPRALGTLNRAIAGREQLWLVLWQAPLADPTGLVTDALEQTYPRLGVGRTFHDVGLLRFDVRAGPLLTESPSVLLNADLAGEVRLLGYDLPVRVVHPGETLYLYLYWQALTPMSHDYKVFTQVLSEGGQIVAQQDEIAGAEGYPTSHWAPGAVVRNRFLLTVHPEASPGRYPLIAGMYRSGSGMSRLPASGDGARGDHVLLTEIEVRPPNDV